MPEYLRKALKLHALSGWKPGGEMAGSKSTTIVGQLHGVVALLLVSTDDDVCTLTYVHVDRCDLKRADGHAVDVISVMSCPGIFTI